MTHVLLVVALVLIWVTVLYGLVLALAGALVARRAALAPPPVAPAEDWPGVSVIVPAHDEEPVIEASLRRLLVLDYPRDRLQVVVVDDASTDATGALCDTVAAGDQRLTVIHVPRGEGGHGKAAALNRALPRCEHELLAVFDADARPRRDAVARLVAGLEGGRYVAAVGRLAKVSRSSRLLNRLTALEYTTFQWTFQAGRSRLFDVVLLTGTNYVVRGSVVRWLGGWDEQALTEDLELSVRLHAAGHRIAFVPGAVADDQDPEGLRTWLRQRTRWLLGNYYVLFHRTGPALGSRRWRAVAVVAELSLLYVTFLVSLVASQAILLGGLLDVLTVPGGPLLAVLWVLAFALFVGTIQLAAALELTDSWRTPLDATLMYLVYCPLWLLVAVRGLVVYVRQRGKVEWAKTPHFSQ